MRNEKLGIVAGFPEFWPRVHDKFPLFFKAAQELEPIQNRIFQKQVSEPLHKILRHISKTVSNSLGALIVLVLNGYGNDAMRVARTMAAASGPPSCAAPPAKPDRAPAPIAAGALGLNG